MRRDVVILKALTGGVLPSLDRPLAWLQRAAGRRTDSLDATLHTAAINPRVENACEHVHVVYPCIDVPHARE